MRQTLLLFFTILSFFGCQAPEAQQQAAAPPLVLPERPNIVWLVAEDLSPYIPPFGDHTVETPTLSRLADEGVRYTRFYSPAPVCSPARASIATGMYPNRIGASHMRTGPWFAADIPAAILEKFKQYMPEGIPPYEAMPPAGVRMMSEYLRMAGYYCTNNAKQDYQFRCPPTAWDESSHTAHWRNRKPGQPFFSIFNLNVTHESKIWAKANDSLWVDENLDVPVPPYLPGTEVGRRDIRRMYSNIKEMDFEVGRILAQLEEDGLLDSTIVFWYSDHGGPLPRQKRLLYDSGLKVPMIIRFPGKQAAGSEDSRLISFIDLSATVLSLAGIEPPENIDGRAFLGKYETPVPHKYLFGVADRFDETTDGIRAALDGRFKYLRYFHTESPMFLHVKYRDQMPIMQELYRLRDAGELTEAQAQWFRQHKPPEELFDTQSDPHELKDLSKDPAYAEKLKELRGVLYDWEATFEDTGLMPEAALVRKLWQGPTQPVTATPEIARKGNEVTITCATTGASIGYKIVENGEVPEAWQVYAGPFTRPEGAKVVAVAQRIGFLMSMMNDDL